ncbi:hypothetical protein KAR91_48085 [Candidatus Pacearchaeota archaeon]|nr:hypothetical protein [Candidatus Pacearchaeota archaeon]
MKEFLKNLWLIKTIIELSKKGFWGNLAAMTIITVVGGWFFVQYVNAKDLKVSIRLEKQEQAQEINKEVQQQMLTALTVMKNTMQNVQTSMNKVQHSVETTENRVWQIRETVYH